MFAQNIHPLQNMEYWTILNYENVKMYLFYTEPPQYIYISIPQQFSISILSIPK